jgi:hypothetical protein
LSQRFTESVRTVRSDAPSTWLPWSCSIMQVIFICYIVSPIAQPVTAWLQHVWLK